MSTQPPVRTYVAHDFELEFPLGLRLKTGTLEVVGVESSGQAAGFLGTMEDSGPVWAVCTVDGLPVRSHQQFGAALARAQRAIDNGAHRRTVNLGFQSIAPPGFLGRRDAGPIPRTGSSDVAVTDAVQSRFIIVDGFPHFESDWRGVPVTPNVIASAIHRTYHVRTSPSMITFVDDIARTSCYVELSSAEDARRVLVQYEKGTSPTLHHRDEAIADWILSISATSEDVVLQVKPSEQDERLGEADHYDATAEGPDPPELAEPVLILEGFPAANNAGWNGVRVNEVVVASMLHRTFGIRTNPGMVTFLDSERATKTRTCRVELASIGDAQQVLLLYSRGKRPTLHRAEGQRGDNPFHLVIRGVHHEDEWLPVMEQSEVLMVGHARTKVGRSNESRPQEMEPESATRSAEAEERSGIQNESESLLLTGLPGTHPAWRFINDKVLASLIHRTFGVRTNPSSVTVGPDRRSCRLSLSSSDARHVMHCTTRGQKITLEHRDARMPGLELSINAQSPSLEAYIQSMTITSTTGATAVPRMTSESCPVNDPSSTSAEAPPRSAWKDPISRGAGLSFVGLPSWANGNSDAPVYQAESLGKVAQPLPSVYAFDMTSVTSNTGITSLAQGYSYFN